jgi:hypothetical protein
VRTTRPGKAAKATSATRRRKAGATPPRRAETAPSKRPAALAPVLNRERRQLPESERLDQRLEDARLTASARTGRDELRQKLTEHTEASPVMTAGDIDAKWEDAYAVGDESPGGDNPTPDQDRVDDIGKALGVTYQDDEELKGSDKVAERDRHRWELDPASSDDWPHNQD